MSDYLDWRVEDFPYQTRIETRWGDNDMLGHLNNVAYNRLIETVVVRFTMGPMAISIGRRDAGVSDRGGRVACAAFTSPLAFPGNGHGVPCARAGLGGSKRDL